MSGSEPKLYWQVSNGEIHCTTETTEASKFHLNIKHGSKQFHITQLESMNAVAVQRKSIFDRTTKPLKLVPMPMAIPQDLNLKIQCAPNKSAVVPQTKIAWEESRFFIKISKGWGRFSRIVAVIEYTEQTETKDNSESHDEKSKMEKGMVKSSRSKHIVVSCAKHNMHDSSDHIVKVMPVHFEPAVTSKLPAPVTLTGMAKGPPPPLHSRIDSDSDGDKTNYSISSSFNESPLESNTSMPNENTESDNSLSPSKFNVSRTESDSSLPSPIDQPSAENDSNTAQEENPNEINNAFLELVGDEYDFPT